MQNFNSAELRPVEFARAYLQKKMLKKPLREDAGADVLRDSPCCVAVRAKRREEQSDRSQKVLLRLPNGCVSLTKTVVEVDREARQPSCTRTRSRTG